MKLCFISYARNSNLDGKLGKFVEKLEKELPGHLPHGATASQVAFFDVTDIQNGDQWLERLATATQTCKVCLCFYSTPYFTSEYSGREVQVFLQRIRAWKKANAGKEARAIIPVTWKPHDGVPDVLKAFQYTNDKQFPAKYHQEGLHALAMRKNRSDSYNMVLVALAAQIAQTIKTVTLPDGDAIGSFDMIPSAFHAVSTPIRYGAAVVLLATPARRAKPFAASAATLDSMIEAVAHRSRIEVREIPLGKSTAAEIQASVKADEMPLLIADRESFESSHNKTLIKKIAVSLGASATVVVVADPVPNAADVAATLRPTMSARLAAWKEGTGSQLVATDASTFQAELERSIAKGRRDLIAAAPAARADDANLQQAAERRGIGLAAQPILVGPGA